MFRTSNFLRWVLFVDAATCTATGLLLLIGAAALEQSLSLPSELLRYAGFSLLPFAMFLLFLATRQHLFQVGIWAVILLNVLWTVDSFLILAVGWVSPTQLGSLLVVAQALGVATLAGLEYVGLRKSLVAAAEAQ